MERKLRIGIIRKGRIAQSCDMPGYASIAEQCEVVALCDANPDTAASAAAKFNVPNEG